VDWEDELARELARSCTCPGTDRYGPGCQAHTVHGRIRQGLGERLAGRDPLAVALDSLADTHFRCPPPGPVPHPDRPDQAGACYLCGGTGEVYHGTGPDGHVWGGECGCEIPYCGGCHESWPCDPITTIADAVGVEIQED
jgi:hypothetical protein